MVRQNNVDVITEAKPHTVKKFELIEKYVEAWAHKILNFRPGSGYDPAKGVIFIDCMSNSGVYKDSHGNRVEGTALRVAKCLERVIMKYPDKEAILYFNDLEEARISHLKKEINELHLKNIKIYFNNQDCNAYLRELDLSVYKNRYQTLLLYDPYNASIDWGAVVPYLNRWGEVIINHMASDTVRGISQAKKSEVVGRYEETYKTSVESLMNATKDDLDKIVMSIIRSNVKKSSYFVSPFAFYSRTNGRIYSLIHCSASVEGIKLYKKTAWQTFGGKSSLKSTHGKENQFRLDFDNIGDFETFTDEQCYYVKDIAKYICDEYADRGIVSWDEVCKKLDVHPIFPSDGFKNEIKKELGYLGIKVSKGCVIFSENHNSKLEKIGD